MLNHTEIVQKIDDMPIEGEKLIRQNDRLMSIPYCDEHEDHLTMIYKMIHRISIIRRKLTTENIEKDSKKDIEIKRLLSKQFLHQLLKLKAACLRLKEYIKQMNPIITMGTISANYTPRDVNNIDQDKKVTLIIDEVSSSSSSGQTGGEEDEEDDYEESFIQESHTISPVLFSSSVLTAEKAKNDTYCGFERGFLLRKNGI